METNTILYIIVAGIIALLLALFQYKYKSKNNPKLNTVFAILRFVTVFFVLLLLINPKFEQLKVYVEKPNLVIALDNSSSIKHLKQDEVTRGLVENLKNNSALSEKFNVDFYTFGNSLKNSDSISFTENETNITKAFGQLSEIYKNSVSPTILISDGNQTFGNDYQFVPQSHKQPIYPVILGDTITYIDLKIQQLNVNKYVYLKNEFPVEAILVYNGLNDITTNFEIYLGSNKVYSKTLRFTKKENSKIITLTLPASSVGVESYKALLVPFSKEKNTINNSQNFAVEIIDQKTNIAIVSDVLHPDLGMFKKSIENNEQRSVSILNPKVVISKLDDFQLFILYQPNNTFKDLVEILDTRKSNRFVVVGTKTDLNFLNSVSKYYQQEITNQTEYFQAEANFNYAPFIIEDLDFESFPPLQSNYGTVSFSSKFESLLNKRVNNIITKDPLLVTFEDNGKKEAVLFGENIWQWRARSFLSSKSFSSFDNFIGNLMQYLASNKKRSRLNVDYESFYKGSQNIIIYAQVFDKNYEFDGRENLTILVKDQISGEEKSFSFIYKNNAFQVDLSNLPPSQYTFKVITANEKLSKFGDFKILEYDVEQQFLNANVEKLQQLASNSTGTSYFINDVENLTEDILNDPRYKAIQKSHKNTVPLIDFRILLFLIVSCLTIEWVLRKYNGLI
jgi:hypothetical protein